MNQRNNNLILDQENKQGYCPYTTKEDAVLPLFAEKTKGKCGAPAVCGSHPRITSDAEITTNTFLL